MRALALRRFSYFGQLSELENIPFIVNRKGGIQWGLFLKYQTVTSALTVCYNDSKRYSREAKSYRIGAALRLENRRIGVFNCSVG